MGNFSHVQTSMLPLPIAHNYTKTHIVLTLFLPTAVKKLKMTDFFFSSFSLQIQAKCIKPIFTTGKGEMGLMSSKAHVACCFFNQFSTHEYNFISYLSAISYMTIILRRRGPSTEGFRFGFLH